ncbi:MAG: FAD-binding protein [Deltaproteobacteria bacterium]|nr:FAD-binding protein [Deltaproteobacteria bacterium]
MGVLRREVYHRGVTVIENVMVTRLFCREGRIAGAFGLCRRTGRRYLFKAKAIILAAGSATGLYLSYSASFLTTGDGYALAYDVGVPLQHLEFQEFTVIPVPRGRPIATGGIKPVTSFGARFFNAQGERFMERYDPQRLELTARAIMVQAVAREVREGRGAFVDATSCKPTYFLKKVERLGVDWRRERVPIRPGVHTFLGGLVVDASGQTPVPGLYSYGENGGHGHLYGADRITGAVGAGFVLGYQAGRQATLFAREHPPLEPAREDVAREEARIKAFGRDDLGPHALNPAVVASQLRRTAEEHLFVYREEHGLTQALGVFQEARHEKAGRVRARSLPALVRCLEVRHLALTGELVARASLARQESRGQFQHVDHPQTDDRRTRIVLRDGGDGDPALEVQEIP